MDGLKLKFLAAFRILYQCFSGFNYFVFHCCKNTLTKATWEGTDQFSLTAKAADFIQLRTENMGAHINFLFSPGPQIQGMSPPTLVTIIQSL